MSRALRSFPNPRCWRLWACDSPGVRGWTAGSPGWKGVQALWGICTRGKLNPDANQMAVSEGWRGPAPAPLCPSSRPGHRSHLVISKELCRHPSTLILHTQCAERKVLSEPLTQGFLVKGRGALSVSPRLSAHSYAQTEPPSGPPASSSSGPASFLPLRCAPSCSFH